MTVMLWACVLIGVVIGLLGFIASLSQSPSKTETVVAVKGFQDLDDWDSQDQLEELEEEEENEHDM